MVAFIIFCDYLYLISCNVIHHFLSCLLDASTYFAYQKVEKESFALVPPGEERETDSLEIADAKE